MAVVLLQTRHSALALQGPHEVIEAPADRKNTDQTPLRMRSIRPGRSLECSKI